MGPTGSDINPVFLNLMSTVISRSKDLILRVGGNSQEQAVLVPDGLEDGSMIEKGGPGGQRVRTDLPMSERGS